MDIKVYDGEYEYLMATDPKFRAFVKRCKNKSIEEIFRDNFRDKFGCKRGLEQAKSR